MNNMYWRADGDGSIIADSENPEPFYLELRDPTKMCIKNASGDYIIAEKNGVFRIGGPDPGSATQWDYWRNDMMMEICFPPIVSDDERSI